ncbi:MAG: hypothetical protein ABJA98_25615 [Acidobacteriota bacterium]
MPFDWREFLVIAHGLRSDHSEGARRTSLGRSYYYIYNLGLKKARALHFKGKLPGLHRQLWDWCQNHTDPNIRQLGVDGLRMHSFRIQADYDAAPIPNLAFEVTRQLARAQTFEALVARSNGQQPPPTLTP